MKKTLAAVLAAAMALSTATVAFATDMEWDNPTVRPGSVVTNNPTKWGFSIGSTTKYLINNVTLEDGTVVGADEIAYFMSTGDIVATVLVTAGQSNLSGRPVLTAGNTRVNTASTNGTVVAATQVDVLKNAYSVYVPGDDGGHRITYAKGTPASAITEIYVAANGAIATNYEAVDHIAKRPENAGDADPVQAAIDNTPSLFEKKNVSATWDVNDPVWAEFGAVELSFTVPHWYGVDTKSFSVKLRFTAKNGTIHFAQRDLARGDTITSEVLNFEQGYGELNHWEEDMQLTPDEVAANRVVYDGVKLANALGGEDKHFSIAFGEYQKETLVFTGRTSLRDNRINLWYNTAINDDIWSAYGLGDYDTSYKFINFRGTPSRTFNLSGQLMFDAINGKDTYIYEYVNGELVPMDAQYNSTYKVMFVEGVKTLADSYLISPVELETEEEPEAPVDSAPTVEDPEDDGNPNTGAC